VEKFLRKKREIERERRRRVVPESVARTEGSMFIEA